MEDEEEDFECNAVDCIRVPTKCVAKAFYCNSHAKLQEKYREKINKYKDDQSPNFVEKELKWRIKEAELRKDNDLRHQKRIQLLYSRTDYV